MILKLEAFHNRSIRNLCRKNIHPTDETGDVWIYPSSNEFLKQVQLKSIGEYIYEIQHNFRELDEEQSPMLEKCIE